MLMVHQNPASVFVATVLPVSCGSSPWVQGPMVPMRWALLRLRTSLKEGDMISFRVEIGSGKAEAVNVELI